MSKVLVPTEQKQVLFYDDEVTAVRVENMVYVPIRPICDYLGVDWSAQLQRIRRDPVLSEEMSGVVVTPIPLNDNKFANPQEMICLPLDYLSGWLFGINANRVKAEIRERLLRYQRECYKVLAEAFQDGRLTTDTSFDELLQTNSEAVQAYKTALAVVKLARNQVLLEARLERHEKDLMQYGERLEQIEATLGSNERQVTPEQASQISQAVKAVALALGKKTNRNEFGACYGELYRRYGITSYKALPAYKFEDAMNFLTEWHQNITANVPF